MKDLVEYSRLSTEEALSLMHHYVFRELHMHRMNIALPAFNEGLIAVLQKLGFGEEVRRREAIYRFGRRWDGLSFGILAAEWERRKADE